jgi:hypothetical protein
MCVGGSPKMAAPAPPPPPPQESKGPDMATTRRKSQPSAIAGGTLLTGPTGVDSSMLNLGGGSLLGG